MNDSSPSLFSRIETSDLLLTALALAAAAATALGATWPDPRFPLLAILVLFIVCREMLVEAARDLLAGRMSMELSMIIAIAAAGLIGEWTTSLIIAAFVVAAEILEDLAMDRGRDALTELMSFLPATARVRRGDGVSEIPTAELSVGDLVLVSPGERVPVDGIVRSGSSTLDESRITGESLPVEVGPGDPIPSGSINEVGALEIEASRVGADSSYGRIVEAVRTAQESEAPVRRLADRLAAGLVVFALLGATLTWLLTRDLTTAISVVVVAGACGVAAGTPLAILAAIARASRHGAFVKDGAHLEELSTIDTIVFDKTGTLTLGEPRLEAIRLEEGAVRAGLDEDRLLALVAAVEESSEHPLGKAIVVASSKRGLTLPTVEGFTYTPGTGVLGRIDGHEIRAERAPAGETASTPRATRIAVLLDSERIASIDLVDEIRPSAAEALAELRRRGYSTVMLTGDSPATARAVGEAVGVERIEAGLLPEDKQRIISQLRLTGAKVALVGDGVNDAPGLALANVGIAMGSGTDIARESGDVILVGSDLHELVSALKVARRARRIVLFNFVGTILVDLVGMVLAAFGFLTPIGAAFIHVGSESAFILNSARLVPAPRGRGRNPRA